MKRNTLLAAFQFLTIFPIKRGFTAEETGRSAAFFPLVGVLIGLLMAGAHWVLSLILPLGLVNIISIVMLVWLSGALHLDGLADTLDGIAGHRTPEQRLAIMRDSRIGGFGAVGVALILLMEYVALNSIPLPWTRAALVVAPVLSRWAMVVAIYAYPYARPSGLGAAFKSAVRRRHLAAATLIAIIVTVVAFRLGAPVIIVLVVAVTILLAVYLKGKLGGLTGDTYGAINEVTTVAAFVAVSMLAYKDWLI